MPGLGDPALQRARWSTSSGLSRPCQAARPGQTCAPGDQSLWSSRRGGNVPPTACPWDILGPFGFQRMPEEDPTGGRPPRCCSHCATRRVPSLAGCETFVFRNGVELHPRPIGGADRRPSGVSRTSRRPCTTSSRPDDAPAMTRPTRRPGQRHTYEIIGGIWKDIGSVNAGSFRTNLRRPSASPPADHNASNVLFRSESRGSVCG